MGKFIARVKQSGHMDFGLFIAILSLCVFGLVMMYSASYYSASIQKADGMYFVNKQLVVLGISIPLMILISYFDYSYLKKLSPLALLLSVALLVLVLFVGKKAYGARRWLEVGGISVQPSEIAKFGLMFYMSAFMANKQHLMQNLVKGMLPMLLVILLVCGLVMLQPNMSMAVIIAMMGIIMLFVGGAKLGHIGLLILGGVVLFVLFAKIEPYRWARLVSFTDPWEDASGDGYQLIQSLYALGAGGLFGQGLNNSRQKLLYLTFGESDFVFSIVGEELGFIGGMLIILLYLFIVYRGMRTAMRCKDRFGSMLAAGISIVFALQVVVNIGVVTGIMPTTGQALPFISAGGTSLIIFMSAMGVLLNISRDTSKI